MGAKEGWWVPGTTARANHSWSWEKTPGAVAVRLGTMQPSVGLPRDMLPQSLSQWEMPWARAAVKKHSWEPLTGTWKHEVGKQENCLWPAIGNGNYHLRSQQMYQAEVVYYSRILALSWSFGNTQNLFSFWESWPWKYTAQISCCWEHGWLMAQMLPLWIHHHIWSQATFPMSTPGQWLSMGRIGASPFLGCRTVLMGNLGIRFPIDLAEHFLELCWKLRLFLSNHPSFSVPFTGVRPALWLERSPCLLQILLLSFPLSFSGISRYIFCTSNINLSAS